MKDILVAMVLVMIIIGGCGNKSPEEKFAREQRDFIKKRDANPKYIEESQKEEVKALLTFEIQKWGVKYNYVQVIGKVTNNGNIEATNIKIGMKITDSSGTVLAQTISYPVSSSLKPGQSSAIKVFSSITETGNKNYWPPVWTSNYPLFVDTSKAKVSWED